MVAFHIFCMYTVIITLYQENIHHSFFAILQEF